MGITQPLKSVVQVSGRTTADLMLAAATSSMPGATASINITPPTAGVYDAFPDIAWNDGTCYVVWRRGTTHTDTGVIMLSKSENFGAFSDPTELISDATYDCRDPSITILSTGRIIVSYFLYDGTKSVGTRVAYSDDDLATLTTVAITSATHDDWIATSAKVLEDRGGDLLIPLYGEAAADTYQSAFYQKSTDRGETWGSETTVLTGTTFSYQEPALCYATADATLGQWMMIARTTAANAEAYYAHGSNLAAWTGPKVTAIHNLHAPCLVPLSDGSHLLGYRQQLQGTFIKRVTYVGGGWTFESGVITIGRNRRGGYPSGVEVAPGVVAFVYYDDDIGSAAPSNIKFCFVKVGAA